MTDNNRPITPPDELRWQWIIKGRSQDYCSVTEYVAEQSARWGYEQRGAVNEAELQKARDEELEECCKWVESTLTIELSDDLHAARRPEPKSRAEKALASLEGVALPEDAWQAVQGALKRLQELEALDD